MNEAADRRRARSLGCARALSTATGRLPQARVAGRWRPYRDVRAAFDPWRRVALTAWTLHENSLAPGAAPGILH